MGIPKFFRWISERYPCLTEEIKEFQIPQFDNLYLDMNGIIHICSHPNDNDPHFRITEEQIFRDIFHYIEVLFRLIQPKKLFFMAVDGVAPRAKMNQQRGRRFSSAKGAELMEKKAVERGETLPTESRFDSNCITPGTEFMARLQEQLKYFVTKKISNDRTWQKPTVILSGHSVPGEGEHKVMEYIRYLKSQPDWDPSTRHCLYGLDADLIILGLTTHEPNFSLLREEVKFVKSNQKRSSTPETTNYCLFHLSLLRDYLDLEFGELKQKLTFGYDLEKIIDDWILMGFLVGNDFIPHLPHLHIANNALSILFETYKQQIPSLDGYINENGILHLGRLEKFLTALSKFDVETFEDTYADMKYFESKTGRSMKTEFTASNGSDGKTKTVDPELRSLIAATEIELFDFGDDTEGEALEAEGLETIRQYEGEDGVLPLSDCSDSTFDKEFALHRRDYYLNKMEYPTVDSEKLRKEAEGYVRALQWILHYYYRGCPSWGWYYPHHYSPYISDLRGFAGLDIEFDYGRPFLPFQQLLAVLPAASKQFLPKGFQSLMCDTDSPILDYYPPDFKVDLNGKRQEWEAVVLIPFIEEDRLLKAMQPHYASLTDDERARNSHGPMQIYNYSSSCLGKYEAPEYFPTILENHAAVRNVWPEELTIPRGKMVVGPHPKAAALKLRYRSGFPTLSRIPFQGHLNKKGVKVFENPSRGENMILHVAKRTEFDSPQSIMQQISARASVVYVGWPHITPAQIEKVVFQDSVCSIGNGRNIMIERCTKDEKDEYSRKFATIKITHMQRLGIDIGDLEGIVYANPLQEYSISFNKKNNAEVALKFAPYTCCYPVSTLVLDVKDDKDCPDGTEELPRTLESFYPLNASVFMICHVCYGYRGKVTGYEEGSLRVEIAYTTEPNMDDIKTFMERNRSVYLPGHVAANRLGISPFLLSRITGTIFVQSPHTDSDKTNLGLSLKFNKANKEAVGLTKKSGTLWLYSEAAVDLVHKYIDEFPEMFEYLSQNINEQMFFKDQMFPGEDGLTKLNEIKAWLKKVTDNVEKITVGSQALEPPAVAALEELLAPYEECTITEARLRILPQLVYMTKVDVSPACPDPKSDFRLLDRVVYIRECHDIPLGLKGIIIGIEKKENPVNDKDDSLYIYDVFFDQEVIGGFAPPGTVSQAKRCYRLTRHVLINISYGDRTYNTRLHYPKSLVQQVKKKRVEVPKIGGSTDMLMPNFGSKNASNWSPNQTSGSVTNFFRACQNLKMDGAPSQPHQIQLPGQAQNTVQCPAGKPVINQTGPPMQMPVANHGQLPVQTVVPPPVQNHMHKPVQNPPLLPLHNPVLRPVQNPHVQNPPLIPVQNPVLMPVPNQILISGQGKVQQPPMPSVPPQLPPQPSQSQYTGFWNTLMSGNQGGEPVGNPVPPPSQLPPAFPSKKQEDPPKLVRSQPPALMDLKPLADPLAVNQQTEALKKILRINSAGHGKKKQEDQPTQVRGQPAAQMDLKPLSDSIAVNQGVDDQMKRLNQLTMAQPLLPSFNKVHEGGPSPNNNIRNQVQNQPPVAQNLESSNLPSRTYFASSRRDQTEVTQKSTKFIPLQVQKMEASRKATPPPAPAPRQTQSTNSTPVQSAKMEPRRGPTRRPRIAAKFHTPLNNP